MHGYLILKALRVHELGCTLEVAQRLVIVLPLTVDGGSQEKQLRHVVEKFETLRDQLEGQVPVTLEDCPGSFLIKLFGAWFLNGKELDDFVMVGVD